MIIDTKTVEQARNTDVIAFFEKHCGFAFAQLGGEYRCRQHQSLAVKADHLSWYWHSKGVGGHDEHNKPRFASLRGTYGGCRFRMDCAGSDKRFGFNMEASAPSERLYIFESPIDAMSHASLAGDWRRDNRLSLAGTSDAALLFFLNQRSFIKELVFCLDNDPAGREASAAMARKYAEKGYHTRIILPAGKDFNEDLQAHMAQMRTDKRANFGRRDVDI